MPSHIALVLDGNRRFARRSGLADPTMGLRMGTEKVDELLAWCDELEIPVVTVWILSIDNLSRDQAELDELIAIVEEGLPHLREVQKGLRNPRRIKVGGRTELLPESLRETIVRVERETGGWRPLRAEHRPGVRRPRGDRRRRPGAAGAGGGGRRHPRRTWPGC